MGNRPKGKTDSGVLVVQLDELITKVGRLSPSRQQEVLDFVAFLEQRYDGVRQGRG